MSRNTHRHRAYRPVFVDASGRRQRTLRVAGVLGVLVAVGYLCVLVSTVLGGPTIQSAFLPLPAAPSPETVVAQHPKPVATGSTTSDPAQPSIVVVASTPVALPTSSSTARPTSTSVPTSATSATTKAKGKPTALPTPTNRPTKTAR